MCRRLVACLMLLAFPIACAGGAESAVNELLEQVRLGDPQASITFQENLDLLESPEALPALIAALENDESAPVREWSARLLGRIGDAQAVPALASALNGPREVHTAAAASLLQIGEEEAERAFIEALRTGSRDAKIRCLVQLEKLGSVAAIGAIAELARGDDALVAQNAVTALGGIGDPAAAEPLAAIAVDVRLPDNLRKAAIYGMASLSGPEVNLSLEQIIEQLEQQEGAEELRDLAQQTLRGSGG